MNDVGSWSTVIDVAENMQLVDGKTLDDVTYGYDESVCSACRDNRINDDIHVVGLVGVVCTLMQELLNDVAETLWQSLSYL